MTPINYSGLAGTVLVYKIAGALASHGGTLDQVYSMATWIASRIATIGVSVGHAHVGFSFLIRFSCLNPFFSQVPGTAPMTADLSSSEIEIGMGIHNESGHSRLSPVPSLSQLIPQLLDFLTSVSDPDRAFVPFKSKDNVVLLVNNLGGVSELELGSVVAEARKELDARGFTVSRILAGTFMVRAICHDK